MREVWQGVTLAGVYVVAAVLQLERFTVVGALAVAVLCTGDVFVHYGEVVFVGIGLAAQIIADVAEAVAMPLLQVRPVQLSTGQKDQIIGLST